MFFKFTDKLTDLEVAVIGNLMCDAEAATRRQLVKVFECKLNLRDEKFLELGRIAFLDRLQDTRSVDRMCVRPRRALALRRHPERIPERLV